MANDVARWLPPPAAGIIHLSSDKTRKDKRGRKHPLGYFSRDNEHAPYTFGFDLVALIASWDRFRFPVAIAPIEPTRKGHQNLLFRQILATFTPPAWTSQVVITADAGSATNPILRLIDDKHWTYVFAMPHTRKFTNDKHVWGLVSPLPKSCYMHSSLLSIKESRSTPLNDLQTRNQFNALDKTARIFRHATCDAIARSTLIPAFAKPEGAMQEKNRL